MDASSQNDASQAGLRYLHLAEEGAELAFAVTRLARGRTTKPEAVEEAFDVLGCIDRLNECAPKDVINGAQRYIDKLARKGVIPGPLQAFVIATWGKSVQAEAPVMSEQISPPAEVIVVEAVPQPALT